MTKDPEIEKKEIGCLIGPIKDALKPLHTRMSNSMIHRRCSTKRPVTDGIREAKKEKNRFSEKEPNHHAKNQCYSSRNQKGVYEILYFDSENGGYMSDREKGDQKFKVIPPSIYDVFESVTVEEC